MLYFYCRVSSKDQNLDRQIMMLKKYGEPDEIFCDKQSGKNFVREDYLRLKAKVKAGDRIVVEELDRFGRNKREIKQELEWFKEHKVIIVILEIPTTMVDWKGQEWLAELVNNIIIEVLGTIAEQERIKNLKRQAEGIEAMKLRGDWDKYGRPKVDIPEFDIYYELQRAGEITVKEACEKLGIGRTTWYNILKGA